MSMSQEEIEALMNGLDIADDSSDTPAAPEEDNATVSTEEIDELISSTEIDDVVETPAAIEEVSIPELEEPAAVIEEEPSLDSNEVVSNDDIDDLLKGLEETSSPAEEIDIDNFDDVLSDIDGIVESTPTIEEPVSTPSIDFESDIDEQQASLSDKDKDEIVKDWTDSKINEGVIPLPAEKDTKVVNQLNQVANDSEEKVGQIFDVLSLGLDNNNEFRNKLSEIESFMASEAKLLNSLNSKFPNINVFQEHVNKIESVNESIAAIKNTMNEEDMKIFEAMELMQFNDINRQKIERVMAVIRKLSLYLNNLFEDDGENKDIAVAKHIHGDSNDDLIGDDLDKLIAEFGN